MARSSISDRVAKHRAALRAAGLRPLQLWVPDVRSPSFAKKAHLQSQAVALSSHESADQAFVNAITDDNAL